MESPRQNADGTGARFVIGMLLITAGISSLLERAHVFDQIELGSWWPLILIVIGLSKLARQARQPGGWGLLGLGAWLLIVTWTTIRFGETWPLLVMVWGAVIIWRGLPSTNEMSLASKENSHAS